MAGKAPRNKTTRSRPAQASNKRYPETRMERGVLLIVGAVLAVAAVVVLAGLYLTEYRPPRAHALTIEGQDYNADAVKRRGSYLLRYETQAARDVNQDNLVERTVDRLVRDEVLNRRAPALVGEITDEELDQEFRIQLGFATPTATPTPTPAPGATPTATLPATATPSPTPEEAITPDAEQLAREEADFLRAQRDVYRDTGLSREEFYRIFKGQLYERRLRDHFADEVGETAPQIRLQVIRLTDRAVAERIHEQALQGADFVRLAAQNSVLPTARQDGGELGWRLVSSFDEPVRAAVEDAAAGSISEIIPVDRFFEIYRVAEVTADRDLDAAQRGTLVAERFDDWLEQETANVQVDRDISDGESDWIRDAIIEDVTDRGAVGTPTPTAIPVG
ncbi:MAG: peptidylprolyl isomerase [Dehalococcoidia bacterium]